MTWVVKAYYRGLLGQPWIAAGFLNEVDALSHALREKRDPACYRIEIIRTLVVYEA